MKTKAELIASLVEKSAPAPISRKQLKHLERKAAAAWYASPCACGEGEDDSLYWRWQEIKGELDRRRNEEEIEQAEAESCDEQS